MSLTTLQRQQRTQWVGASSVASIMGENPWETAYDLWAKLTGKVDADDDAGEAASIGDALEPAIKTLSESRIGCKLVRPTGTFKHDTLPLGANVDFMREKAIRGSQIVEAKSTGIADGWGEEGTDEVPARVMLQVQAQMMCAASDVAHVARLFGRFGFKFDLYTVEAHAGLQQAIADHVGPFWQCVQSDRPPAHSFVSASVSRLIRRVPGKVIQGDAAAASLIDDYRAAKAAVKAAETIFDEAEGKLKSLLVDAEALEVPGWSYRVSTVKRKGYVVEDCEYKRFTLKEIK